jgi:catechol 2,3-dioxygenase-like lactoylglutathione lyase family enzyme
MLFERRVQAVIPTADLEAGRRFYEGTLNLEPGWIGETAIFYAMGEGTSFALSMSSGQASGTHTQMVFLTPDIDSDVAELRSRGISTEEYATPNLTTVDGIAQMGPNRAAWFKDPEGNLLGIIQLGEA